MGATLKKNFFSPTKVQLVLQRINHAYVEGCVAHYDTAEGNDWEKAFIEMEMMMLSGDENKISKKLIWFEIKIMTLIARYKKIHNQLELLNRGSE